MWSQNGTSIGSPSNSNPSGGSSSKSRNDRHASGPGTSGRVLAVSVNPVRGAPNTATVVWPARSRPSSAPAARTVAVSWDIDRPRRRASTSIVTGPAGTAAANTVVSVRRDWSGRPSSAAMARAATAAMSPPWGTVGQAQWGSTSAR
jgi:hypothetical protein